jgi:hypothetical protein
MKYPRNIAPDYRKLRGHQHRVCEGGHIEPFRAGNRLVGGRIL